MHVLLVSQAFVDLGRMAIYFFKELGSTGNDFRGAEESKLIALGI